MEFPKTVSGPLTDPWSYPAYIGRPPSHLPTESPRVAWTQAEREMEVTCLDEGGNERSIGGVRCLCKC